MIKKAVFPIGGLGTRFLPATKAIAKEMLPIVDKPVIQYAVEEAYEAGIRQIIFITGRTKRSVEDHFDTAYELEYELARSGKTALLNIAREVAPSDLVISYIRQPGPLGLGHAVLCAETWIGHEDFAVILPDDLMRADPGVMGQMMKAHQKNPSTLMAIQTISEEQKRQYGVIDGDLIHENYIRINKIIEKPGPGSMTSNWGIVGRYILQPAIFDALRNTQAGLNQELQLTDALATLLKNKHPLAGYVFQGTRYDCGNKLGFLKATVELAKEHPEMGADFKAWLQKQQ